MSEISLNALLQRADLGLSVVCAADPDRLDRPVRWVTRSELADPTPYLRGGEFLLTTGGGVPDEISAALAYAGRLLDVGVIGIGFGIGFPHDAVPEVLVECARETGLPILAVAKEVPFIAISEAVGELRVQAETIELTETLRAQRILTDAAAREGPAGVIRRLAGITGLWVILTDFSGIAQFEAPAQVSAKHHRWRSELGRLRGGTVSSAAVGVVGEHVTVYKLGSSGRLRGFLVAGGDSAFSSRQHHAVNVAIALLSVALEHRPESHLGAESRRALVTAAVDHPELTTSVLASLTGVFRSGEMVVLAVSGPPTAIRQFENNVDSFGLNNAFSWVGRSGALLCAVMPSALPQIVEIPGLVCGASTPVPPRALARAIDEAVTALDYAARSRRPFRTFAEIGSSGALEAIRSGQVAAFAQRTLQPLREYEATTGTPLMDTLGAWLAHHGQYDAAATGLGVHRNTVRNRIRTIGRIVGGDLDSADFRMALWLALAVEGAAD